MNFELTIGDLIVKRLLLILSLLIPSLAYAQDIETQKENIETLRSSAKYEECLKCSEQLLKQYEKTGKSTAMNLALVKWQIKTFTDILALSNDDRTAFTATDTLWNQAVQLFLSRDLDGAKEIMSRRLQDRRNYLGSEHPDYGESCYYLGLVEYNLGNFNTAIEIYNQSLDIIAKSFGEQSPFICKYTNDLVEALVGAEKFQESLSVTDKNIELCKVTLEPSDADYLEALDLRVIGLKAAGEKEKAIEALTSNYNLKVELFGPESPSLAETLYSLACLEALEGKYILAEAHFIRGRELLELGSGADHENNTYFYNAMGKLYIDLGDLVKAKQCMEKSLLITKNNYPKNHPKIAVIYSGFTALAYKQKEYEQCLEYGRQTRSMLKESDNTAGVTYASATSTMALASKSLGNYALSDSLHSESISLFRHLYNGAHFNLARIITNHATLYMSMNKIDKALLKLTESQQMLLDIDNTTCGLYIDNLKNMGIIALHQKGQEDAVKILTEAVDAYEAESIRTGSGNRAAQHLDSPYPALAIAKLDAGDKVGAWLAIEQHNGRSLNYSLQLDQLNIPTALVSERDSLSRLLLTLEDDTHEKSIYQADLALLNLEINKIYQQEIPTKCSSDILNLIPQNTTVIGWIEFYGPLIGDIDKAYIITSDGTIKFIDFEFDNELNKSLISELSQPKLGVKSSNKVCKQLWDEWVEPIWESCSSSEKLLIIPPDELAGIPLECAMNQDGQYLGDLIEVYYSPNLTFGISEANSSNENSSILALGDPPFNENHIEVLSDPVQDSFAMISPETTRDALNKDPDALAKLPRLSGSRYEAISIANMFDDSSLFIGTDASEQNLLTLGQTGGLADYSYIHLATHVLIDGMQPDKSAIVLNQLLRNNSADDGYLYDGLITAEEIRINWKLNARLVTLSACNSALGRKTSGNGHLGFSQPLLAAGADNLLLSMWRAGDKSTSMLMTRFYENVTKGESLGASLQEAKLWLRNYKTDSGKKPYRHPFYWGGFVLIGKG